MPDPVAAGETAESGETVALEEPPVQTEDSVSPEEPVQTVEETPPVVEPSNSQTDPIQDDLTAQDPPADTSNTVSVDPQPELEPAPTPGGQGETKNEPDSEEPGSDEGKDPDASDQEEPDRPIEFHVTVDTIEVVAKTTTSILPEGAEMRVSRITEADTEEYQSVKSVLEQEPAEFDGMIPLDVTFYENDLKIAPENGPITIQVRITRDSQMEKAIPESMVMYSIQEQSEIRVQEVASYTDKRLAVTEQAVSTEFEIESFSTLVLIWKTSNQTSAEIPSASNKLVENAANKSSIMPTSDDTEKLVMYALYTYTILPGRDNFTYNEDAPDAHWNGMGKYKILAPQSPSQLGTGNSIAYSTLINDSRYKLSIPTKKGETIGKYSYPPITYNNKTYTYDPAGTEAETYQIEWNRLISSNGANAGNNEYNPTEDSGTLTYHLDGFIRLRDTNLITVDFQVLYPGEEAPGMLMNKHGVPYATTMNAPASEKSIAQPTSDNSDLKNTLIVDGVEYEFDGWYRKSDFTDKSEWDQTLNENQTYYGKYVPKNRKLIVTNTVQGNMGDREHSFQYTLEFRDLDGKLNQGDILAGQSPKLNYNADEGKYSFTLTHNESTKELVVPANLTYTITQTDGQDHITKASTDRDGETYNEKDQSLSHDTKQDTKVKFVNEKNHTVPTGIKNQLDSSSVLFVYAAGAGLLILSWILRKRWRTDEH